MKARGHAPAGPAHHGPPPPDLADLIQRARGSGRAADAAGGRMRRLVVRAERPLIDRLDALREHFPDTSRASLIRAFIALGMSIAEERLKATTRDGAP